MMLLICCAGSAWRRVPVAYRDASGGVVRSGFCMTKDEYRRLSVALAILAPFAVFSVVIMLSGTNLTTDMVVDILCLSFLASPVAWGIVRFLGWIVPRLTHLFLDLLAWPRAASNQLRISSANGRGEVTRRQDL